MAGTSWDDKLANSSKLDLLQLRALLSLRLVSTLPNDRLQWFGKPIIVRLCASIFNIAIISLYGKSVNSNKFNLLFIKILSLYFLFIVFKYKNPPDWLMDLFLMFAEILRWKLFAKISVGILEYCATENYNKGNNWCG